MSKKDCDARLREFAEELREELWKRHYDEGTGQSDDFHEYFNGGLDCSIEVIRALLAKFTGDPQAPVGGQDD